MQTDAVTELLAIIQTTKYLAVSSAAILLFDWALTLDVEVAYARNTSWSLGKTLFFLERYPTFIVTGLNLYYEFGHDIFDCDTLSQVIELMTLIGAIFAEAILTLRVWALWKRHLGVGIFLATMFVACSIFGGVGHCFLSGLRTVIPINSISPMLSGCSPFHATGRVDWATISLMIYVNVIFALTLVAGFRHYRQGFYGVSSLTDTLYQDGILYYAVLLGFSAAYTIMVQAKDWVITPTFLLSIHRVIHSILSSRMLLHIYEETAPSQEMEDIASIRIARMGAGALARI